MLKTRMILLWSMCMCIPMGMTLGSDAVPETVPTATMPAGAEEVAAGAAYAEVPSTATASVASVGGAQPTQYYLPLTQNEIEGAGAEILRRMRFSNMVQRRQIQSFTEAQKNEPNSTTLVNQFKTSIGQSFILKSFSLQITNDLSRQRKVMLNLIIGHKSNSRLYPDTRLSIPIEFDKLESNPLVKNGQITVDQETAKRIAYLVRNLQIMVRTNGTRGTNGLETLTTLLVYVESAVGPLRSTAGRLVTNINQNTITGSKGTGPLYLEGDNLLTLFSNKDALRSADTDKKDNEISEYIIEIKYNIGQLSGSLFTELKPLSDGYLTATLATSNVAMEPILRLKNSGTTANDFAKELMGALIHLDKKLITLDVRKDTQSIAKVSQQFVDKLPDNFTGLLSLSDKNLTKLFSRIFETKLGQNDLIQSFVIRNKEGKEGKELWIWTEPNKAKVITIPDGIEFKSETKALGSVYRAAIQWNKRNFDDKANQVDQKNPATITTYEGDTNAIVFKLNQMNSDEKKKNGMFARLQSINLDLKYKRWRDPATGVTKGSISADINAIKTNINSLELMNSGDQGYLGQVLFLTNELALANAEDIIKLDVDKLMTVFAKFAEFVKKFPVEPKTDAGEGVGDLDGMDRTQLWTLYKSQLQLISEIITHYLNYTAPFQSNDIPTESIRTLTTLKQSLKQIYAHYMTINAVSGVDLNSDVRAYLFLGSQDNLLRRVRNKNLFFGTVTPAAAATAAATAAAAVDPYQEILTQAYNNILAKEQLEFAEKSLGDSLESTDSQKFLEKAANHINIVEQLISLDEAIQKQLHILKLFKNDLDGSIQQISETGGPIQQISETAKDALKRIVQQFLKSTEARPADLLEQLGLLKILEKTDPTILQEVIKIIPGVIGALKKMLDDYSSNIQRGINGLIATLITKITSPVEAVEPTADSDG